MLFIILSTILDLMFMLVSVNYFGNLVIQTGYKYYVPKNRSFLKHKKSQEIIFHTPAAIPQPDIFFGCIIHGSFCLKGT